MLNTVLIDTGPLIALFDRDDKYHTSILEFIKNTNYRFISTPAVLTETMYMLDFNVAVQLSFLEWIMKEGVIIHEIKQSNIKRVIDLTRKYSDRPMDFADATLVIAAEERGIRQIISIDSDIYRLYNKMKIENIFAHRR
jgi:PIN domain protein